MIGPSTGILLLAGLLAQAPPEPSPGPASTTAAAPADEAPTSTPAAGAPEGFAISTRLDPPASSIGDLLTYEVTVAYPAGHTVNVPRGLELPGVEVVGVHEDDPESTGEGMRKVFRLELQQFAVGEVRIPPFELTRVGPGGEVLTLRVPEHRFEVASLLANEADPQLQPDDPPVSLDYPNTLAEIVIYATLGAFALAGLIAWAFITLSRREKLEVAPPPVPPHVAALEALGRLEGERDELLEAGDYQAYYLRLTDIAKAYLEGRFGILANDRTTEEIRRELLVRGHRIAPLSPDEVLSFLQSCDLVKFARFAPPEDEARDALYRVRRLVERSRPVVRRDEGGGGSAGGADVPQPAARDGAREGREVA